MARNAIFLGAGLLSLAVSSASVGEEPSAGRLSSGGVYVGIATGGYFPIQKWPSSYTLGGGGNLIVGYQFDLHWSLQLDTTMWLLSGDGRDTWDLKVIPQVRLDIGTSVVRPFVLTGFGFNYQLDQPGSSSTIRPVLTAGLGLGYEFRTGCRLFIEVLGYLVFGPVTTKDLPVVAGLVVNF